MVVRGGALRRVIERCPISSPPAEGESVLAYPTAQLDQPTVHSPLHIATSLYKAQVKITHALDKASLITEYRVLDCSLHIAFIYKNIKLSISI